MHELQKFLYFTTADIDKMVPSHHTVEHNYYYRTTEPKKLNTASTLESGTIQRIVK